MWIFGISFSISFFISLNAFAGIMEKGFDPDAFFFSLFFLGPMLWYFEDQNLENGIHNRVLKEGYPLLLGSSLFSVGPQASQRRLSQGGTPKA